MTYLSEILTTNLAFAWASLGVLLLIVEAISTNGFFISFAVSAFAMALAKWIGVLPSHAAWQAVIFGVVGVVLIPIFRKLLRKYADRTPDINQY